MACTVWNLYKLEIHSLFLSEQQQVLQRENWFLSLSLIHSSELNIYASNEEKISIYKIILPFRHKIASKTKIMCVPECLADVIFYWFFKLCYNY